MVQATEELAKFKFIQKREAGTDTEELVKFEFEETGGNAQPPFSFVHAFNRHPTPDPGRRSTKPHPPAPHHHTTPHHG